MKDFILKALKVRFNGVNEQALSRIAEVLAKIVTKSDDVQATVDAVTFQQIIATALKELHCNDNRLTSLDVSKNTALTSLQCYNNQLISLDVNKNTTLTSLQCFNNQLVSLDISKNSALTSLACSINQLTSLDVIQNIALTSLLPLQNSAMHRKKRLLKNCKTTTMISVSK